MKILGINSSPRRTSNTVRLLSAVLEGAADSGCETEGISLSEYEILWCRGCETCYRTGSCVITDDLPEILGKILDADGIVLASPNYINNVNARMKALLDRMADMIHCQRLLGKFCAAVSTAGGSGSGEVAAYLNQSMFLMGADVAGAASVNLSDGKEAFEGAVKESYALGQNLADLVRRGIPCPEQAAGHAEMLDRMKALISMHAGDWEYQYDYFTAKKWV